MKTAILTLKESNATQWRMKRIMAFSLAWNAAFLAGCVQVSAPDEPIVIELNINVEQRIQVELQQDIENLIEENPELFPE